ncbi:MAG TPA: flavodoxin domain-containing protein [Ktedonobacteraceae bacterium]|nr:flavodoxin domain-containing protein [Ktedonobacteraceae bacterium]
MNTLIIYDSQFGNTEQLARCVADKLAGYGTVRLLRVPEDGAFERREADMLIVGGPTQRHGTSQAMRAFLESIPRSALQGQAAAAFDTRYHLSAFVTGSAATRIAAGLKRAGASLIVLPESFFVAKVEGPLEQGEIERAGEWAEQMYAAFEASKNTKPGKGEVKHQYALMDRMDRWREASKNT